MSYIKFLIIPATIIVAYAALSIAVQTQVAEAQNRPINLNEKAQGFAVVELFTSEGCSSCPPAEDHLNDLAEFATKNPNLKLYPLAFHVDYWDYIGWKDRFATPEFTQRQRRYASMMSRSSVYTPQMIVNGRDQFVGSRRGSGEEVLTENLAKSTQGVPTLTFTAKTNEDNSVDVSYLIDGKLSPQYSVVVAVVESNLLTEVQRGENRGRTLTHHNVVRGLKAMRAQSKDTISVDYPTDANRDNLAVIAFIQNVQTMKILAANRVPL